MKSHPVRRWKGWIGGFNQTDPPDRLPPDQLVELLNAHADATGRIVKHEGTYPVTMASDVGVSELTGKNRMHAGGRFRGPSGDQRALIVVGDRIHRSGPNNLFDVWPEISFPSNIEAPALDRVAAFAFKGRYGYHQNGVDIPFRVEMESADGTTGSYVAEALGLLPPLHGPKLGTPVAGTLFPPGSTTDYAVTFVYGDRGESGPSPVTTLLVADPLTYDEIPLVFIPVGGPGVTARRLYRSQIGHGAWQGYDPDLQRQRPYGGPTTEMFFRIEIPDNTTTTFTDGNTTTTSGEDAALDYSRRCPPPRPFPPRSYYQVIHQDHFAWLNLRDHPWVMGIVSDPFLAGSAATISISNTANGTITVTMTGGTAAGSKTVNDYKTKSLRTIWEELVVAPDYGATGAFNLSTSTAGQAFVVLTAPGVDWDRTYVFREVTNESILGDANTMWLEAIDGDPITVDGCQRFPNRLMWSNILYPEEINPFNFVDLNKNDAYPGRGLFRNDFTLGIFTSEHVWLLTGSLSADPVTFRPDFSIAATNSEAGNFCTRPDSIAVAPEGVYFIAEDGLRLYSGGRSKRIARGIDKRLLVRLLVEPRARDNVSLSYIKGKLRIAYPGMEVA